MALCSDSAVLFLTETDWAYRCSNSLIVILFMDFALVTSSECSCFLAQILASLFVLNEAEIGGKPWRLTCTCQVLFLLRKVAISNSLVTN